MKNRVRVCLYKCTLRSINQNETEQIVVKDELVSIRVDVSPIRFGSWYRFDLVS